MKLTYTVVSTDPLMVKFFYEKGDQYGEFYMNFTKLTSNINNKSDALGVSGEVEITSKDRDYNMTLAVAFAHAMGINMTREEVQT